MSKRQRLQAISATLLALSLPALMPQAVHAQAASFPNKPIKLVVPFPPGGPSDTTARSIAEGLGKVLGQPVVVENKPGAGAIVGSETVLAQPSDGHTLLMASNVISTGKWLFPRMTFDPLRDFRAVAGVFRSPHHVVVSPSFQGQGIQDLITMAKQQEGRMNYGSGGSGTMPHLGAERFKQVTGVGLVHIPYRGSAPANTAVLANEVPVHFDIGFSVQPLMKAGRLRSLGVTSLKRSPQFPDVPTLDEQGLKGFELYSTFGIVAPTGTPDAVVAKLNQAINQVMETPEFKQRLETLGAEKIGGEPEVFQRMINDDHQLWGEVIRKANIRLD
ncbi:Bug family tripartite tricarboxylate transporter substrate binding protein [Hydrogenophaga sp.]|jgi:tripartite-type tricarboxylate transporter receptor subunit TctC|uniref:Bug family tripartite tricarboxylate transporter substrate binding protein n=1 Tax=Hydrogenophaga sp. TaxID=1904254 RepID=UPI003F70ADF2